MSRCVFLGFKCFKFSKLLPLHNFSFCFLPLPTADFNSYALHGDQSRVALWFTPMVTWIFMVPPTLLIFWCSKKFGEVGHGTVAYCAGCIVVIFDMISTYDLCLRICDMWQCKDKVHRWQVEFCEKMYMLSYDITIRQAIYSYGIRTYE